ncbi:ATP-binding protein [Subtercola sp. RTI3]|uniref:ATP-binding protein n=1 Tax=Subtercola sp. RTI3 TaxID=3048639 RepID=UPI002B2325DF|nr:ATP-binding protein [Subtercola sp. RTI3]MEA9985972.1 ATP-binding protein [Subtercola sp. RTI3]
MTTTTTAVTPASVYQQLRGHLTDLKLADAADALPGILDQAQAEGWSLTQALEHLLAIEVTATDARRLTGRFRFANLPTGATLNDLDFDLDAASGIDSEISVQQSACCSMNRMRGCRNEAIDRS